MQLLDRDILQSKAMIIDGNATSRSIMAAQLRELGVPEVRQVSRVQDARLALERQPHDIVLCEMDFDGGPMSGQDLLDELRREQLLPHGTAFILITGSASYAQVMEAAESTVDAYLVKPYSAAVLAQRLAQVRQRKRELEPLYTAIRNGEIARAAELAQQRFEARSSHWKLAAQMAAELWLRAEQPERALAIYEAVLAERAHGFARLGVARARLAKGEPSAARRQLEALVASEPGFADAHDLLARVCIEQGEFEAALASMASAAALTPGCLVRQQHHGALAWYLGARDDAKRQLERALALGRGSKLLDAHSLALLALLRLDGRDARTLGAVVDMLTAWAAAAPENARLQRLGRLASALAALHARRDDEALAVVRELAAAAALPEFDLEAAVFTLALWVRLPPALRDDPVFEPLLRTLALRFGVSKAATETLVGAVGDHPTAAETIRAQHAEIAQAAEQAMNHALKGRAGAAVQMLLEQGEQSGNAKLIEMAGAVTRRYADQIPEVEAVRERAKALQGRWCAPATHLAGVLRSARCPGGVVLRG